MVRVADALVIDLTGSPPAEVSDGDLVVRARAGEQAAWDGLVERFSGLVWSVARAHRLDDADAGDVVQTTWLRLVEHLDSIRQPGAVGAWLATTARRECLRVIRRDKREIASEDAGVYERAPEDDAPDTGLLDDERDELVRAAMEELPDHCQRLLRVLMADPAPSYREVSAALDMPVGSIGPTRGRCLERLRTHLERAGVSHETARTA